MCFIYWETLPFTYICLRGRGLCLYIRAACHEVFELPPLSLLKYSFFNNVVLAVHDMFNVQDYKLSLYR